MPYLVVLALPLIIVVTLLLRAETRTPRARAAVKLWKPLATLITIAIASLSFTQAHSHPVYGALILAGLLCSLLGDWLLIDQDKKPKLFVYGLVAFLGAHLFYIAAFAFARRLLVVPSNPTRDVVVAVALLVLGGAVFFYLRPSLGKLSQPVLLYMTVISLMLHQATIGVELGRGIDTQGALAVGGALFFYASDFMLAMNKFVLTSDESTNSVWVLSAYYGAQFLIALSASFIH